jgi:hypothetical protein
MGSILGLSNEHATVLKLLKRIFIYSVQNSNDLFLQLHITKKVNTLVILIHASYRDSLRGKHPIVFNIFPNYY